MCTRLGADPRGARLLRFTNNAVYALDDLSVVVRIVGSPVLQHRAGKVVEVARHLERRGVPAVRLAPNVDQPVRVGEYLATVWRWVPDEGRRATADELADLLLALHAAGVPDGVGAWSPLDDVRTRVRAATDELSAEESAFLLGRCDELDSRLAELEFPLGRTLIHGDAHAGNAIVGPDGPVLCDFDSASVGPPEWDLTPVAVGCARFGDPPSWHRGLAQRYGVDVAEWDGFDTLREARELKLATSVLPATDRRADVRAELRRRIADLHAGDRHRRWVRYR